MGMYLPLLLHNIPVLSVWDYFEIWGILMFLGVSLVVCITGEWVMILNEMRNIREPQRNYWGSSICLNWVPGRGLVLKVF